jgi:hypothetical protein
MFIVVLFVAATLFTQADYLDQVKKDVDNGAEWHYIEGGQLADPKAKQLFNADVIYWKLKKGVLKND